MNTDNDVIYLVYSYFVFVSPRTSTDANETSMDNPANINEQHYEMITNNAVQKAMVTLIICYFCPFRYLYSV
jgi:hypothetical protein